MHPLWPTFVVFGFALLLAHLPVLRVKWCRNGIIADKDRWARNCERSDYLYLALAAMALIPASNDVDRFLRNQELRTHLGREVLFAELNSALNETVAESRDNGLPYAVTLAPSPEVTKYSRVVLEYENRAWKYLLKAQELLLNGRAEEADVYLEDAQTLFVKIVETPLPRNDARLLAPKEFAEHQLQKIQDIRQRCAPLKRKRLESSLYIFGPYLLAVGLAIRVAKTSAKLQLELQKVYEKTRFGHSPCEVETANTPAMNSGGPPGPQTET